MSERVSLSEIPYLNHVDVSAGSRDLLGRFLPRGGARVVGRGTENGSLTFLELLYSSRRGVKPGLRRVGPGLMVQDLGSQDRKPLRYPEQFNGNY